MYHRVTSRMRCESHPRVTLAYEMRPPHAYHWALLRVSPVIPSDTSPCDLAYEMRDTSLRDLAYETRVWDARHIPAWPRVWDATAARVSLGAVMRADNARVWHWSWSHFSAWWFPPMIRKGGRHIPAWPRVWDARHIPAWPRVWDATAARVSLGAARPIPIMTSRERHITRLTSLSNITTVAYTASRVRWERFRALVQLHYLECEARASLGKRWSTLYLKVWFSIPAHSSTLLGSLYFCVHTHGVKLTSEFLQCMYLLVPVGHWFLWLFDVIWHFGPVYKKHTNTPPTNRSSGGLTTSGARAKRGFPLVEA